MKSYTVADYSEVTIRRPSGALDTVRTQYSQMDPQLFARIKDATLKAGRGECLSYRNVTKEVTLSATLERQYQQARAYDAAQAAVYRAMDAQPEGSVRDRTPAHPSDM